jgi:ubiquinone/menaquinone biosynthesis C-methylase UbiE
MDVSEKLIEFAKNQYEQCDRIGFLKINPDQERLPFPDNYFNTVYSIAVFHHIPSWKKRLEIAKELQRTLKSGDYIIVTAWNLWQKRYRKNIFKNWIKKIFKRSELDWNDCYISFTDNEGQKFNRFHHAFTVRDMRKLFERAGFETERCEIVGGRNVVFVGKKI